MMVGVWRRDEREERSQEGEGEEGKRREREGRERQECHTRASDHSLLREVFLVVERTRGLVHYGTGHCPSMTLAQLPPQHILGGEALEVAGCSR